MNKKLIKTITCLTCGLGIASSIPATITSCSSQETKSNPISVSLMTIEEGKITGFTGDISQYDELQIPSNVTTLTDDLAQILYDNPNIHILSFAKEYSNSINGLNTNFFNQTHIDYLDLENYYGTIQPYDFRYATYLKTVSFKNSNCVLQQASFQQSSIENINLDNYHHDLPGFCFKQASLKYVDFSKYDNDIDSSSFRDCENLTGINLTNFKKNIYDLAFVGCPLEYNKVKLTYSNPAYTPHVTNHIKMLLDKQGYPVGCVVAGDFIYDDVKSFGIRWDRGKTGSFLGCYGITSLDLTGYETTGQIDGDENFHISFHASQFSACSNISSIKWSKIEQKNSNVSFSPLAFATNNKIKSLKLEPWNNKDGVMVIMNYAFQNWNKLLNLELSGTMSVDKSAFYNCPVLSTLNLSNFKGLFNGTPFTGCVNLHEIYMPTSKPEFFDRWTIESLSDLPSKGVVYSTVKCWQTDGDILAFLQSKGLPKTWTFETIE